MKIKLSLNPIDLCLFAIVVLTLLAACSCSTMKKQQAKAESFYYQNPDLLAKKAEQMFPNIIEGTTKGRVDTVRDVTTLQGERGEKGEAGAPGSVRIIQTHSTDTVKIESGVKVAQMQIQVDKLTATVNDLMKAVTDSRDKINALQLSIAEVTESRNRYRYRFFILVAMVVAFVGVRLYKRFF